MGSMLDFVVDDSDAAGSGGAQAFTLTNQQIPTVTSRYPLWDVKSPQLTTDVPHTKRGDEHVDVDVAGRHAGGFQGQHSPGTPQGASNPDAEQTLEKYKAKGQPDRGYTQAWAAMMDELDQGVGRLLDSGRVHVER